MPTLLTKFLQSQCIVSLNENNSFYEEKVYEKKTSYKIYDSLDQVKSKLIPVEGGVLSGIMLINDESFYACINGKKVEKMGLFFIKLSLLIRKDIENGTSGVPQLRFIIWIQINLHLVTKRN